MKTSIQMLSLENLEFFFLFNHQHKPIVEIQGHQFSSLHKLIQKFPLINQPQHLDKLAQIANFLAKGLEFQFIQNIDLYRENYYQQIETEQSSLLYEGFNLKDYGVFDLSVMHPPLLIDQKLSFFVKHDYLGIPYKVTLMNPLNSNSPNGVSEKMDFKENCEAADGAICDNIEALATTAEKNASEAASQFPLKSLFSDTTPIISYELLPIL